MDLVNGIISLVDAGTDTKTIQNMYVANDATNVMTTSGSFDVTAVKVPEKDSWW